MCVRSKDQFPSLHCREHGLEITFSWCPGNWPLVALECDISRWTEEPLLFSLTKRYHKKLRYIKIFVLKPVVGRRLCYKAKLGLQFSVAWMNVRPLMFLPNFLLSVPQRVAVAMLAVFSHLGLPCGCSSLEVSWWALMAVNSGLLCCKWGRMLRLIQITRKPAVGCSCNCWRVDLGLCCDRGGGTGTDCTYSFLQELPLLYSLFCIGFFSSSLENPVPIKSPVCMWEYWNTDNLMWKSFWS